MDLMAVDVDQDARNILVNMRLTGRRFDYDLLKVQVGNAFEDMRVALEEDAVESMHLARRARMIERVLAENCPS